MEDKTRHIESLFKQHYQAMYRLAFMMLHDKEESRDIVHDVFARLLDGDIRFDSGKAGAFLSSCVRNACLNVMRSQDARERAMRDFPINDEDPGDSEAFESEIKALQNGISRLTPPVCREIILLHYRLQVWIDVQANRHPAGRERDDNLQASAQRAQPITFNFTGHL